MTAASFTSVSSRTIEYRLNDFFFSSNNENDNNSSNTGRLVPFSEEVIIVFTTRSGRCSSKKANYSSLVQGDDMAG